MVKRHRPSLPRSFAAAAPPPPPASLLSAKIIMAGVLIVLAGLLVYANSLTGTFVWDDETLVRDNILVRDFKYLPRILFEPIGAGTGRQDTYYRPLQMFTYLVDHALWGRNPFGYHLTNVLIHVAAALAVWWLISLMTANTLVAFWAALLFVVHPIHTEGVAYISGRADSMVLLFLALASVFYVKRWRDRSITTGLGLVASYFFALLSRENALIFPFLVLLFHYLKREPVRWKDWALLLGISIVYGIARSALLPATVYQDIPTNVFERLPGFFIALWNYLKLMVFPYPLHMEYQNQLFSYGHPEAIAGLLILIGLGVAIVRGRRSRPGLVFCLGWFLIALFPFASIYPIKTYMAEHWMYMPSVGLFWLAAAGLARLARFSPAMRWVAAGVVAFLVFGYSVMTVRQNQKWLNPLDLFEWTVKYAPESAGVRINLGVAYKNLNRNKEAREQYEEAVVIDPNSAEAHNNLANVDLVLEDTKGAARHYERAIELKEDYAEPRFNLALLYKDQGRVPEAIKLFREAIRLRSDFASTYNNLAADYEERNDKETAGELYGMIVEARPDYAMARNNLANIYKSKGRLDEAVDLYRKAIELDPRFLIAYFNLGLTYQSQGRHRDAVDMFRKVVALDPKYGRAYRALVDSCVVLNDTMSLAAYIPKAEEFGFSVPDEIKNPASKK